MDEIIYKKIQFKTGDMLKWKKINIKLNDEGVTFYKKKKIHLFLKFTNIKDIYIEKKVIWEQSYTEIELTRTILEIVDNENCIYSTFLYTFMEFDSRESIERTQELKFSIEKAIYHKSEHYLNLNIMIKNLLLKLIKIKHEYSTTGFDKNFNFTGESERISYPPEFFDEIYEKIMGLPYPKVRYEEYSELPTVYICSVPGDTRPENGLSRDASKNIIAREFTYTYLEKEILYQILWRWMDLSDHELIRLYFSRYYELRHKGYIQNTLPLKDRNLIYFISDFNELLLEEIKKFKINRPTKEETITYTFDLSKANAKKVYDEKVTKDVNDYFEGTEKDQIQNSVKNITQKLEKMLKLSDKLRLDVMRDVLDLDQKLFNNLIFDWAADYGFRISGDYIIIENADIDGFISSLDEQFALWQSQSK